tara:strand:- start:7338 stop:7961 length:624 start_codon:yes stop_codon:yes gene_type:complete
MNSWNKSLQVGTQGELEVVEYINKIRPEWKLERIAGANELDAHSIHGGWEIKTYADWYRNPLIEVACLSGVGDTMWLKDKRIKIICLNHFGWLHIYNAEKMRNQWKKGTFEQHAYTKDVQQEDASHTKEMQFFSIKDTSELRQHFTEWNNDHLRWNMGATFKYNPDDNPYMCSIPMQKRVSPLPKKLNLELLRTLFKSTNKTFGITT